MATLASGAGWRENVRFLVAEAARHGHGDARVLLDATADGASTGHPVSPVIEDPQFIDEIRKGMSPPLVPQLPAATDRAGAFEPARHTGPGGQEAAALPRLVRVPAPRLDQVRDAGPLPREMPRPESCSSAGPSARAQAAGLDDLTAEDRSQIEEATAVVRRSRNVVPLGMPKIRPFVPDRHGGTA